MKTIFCLILLLVCLSGVSGAQDNVPDSLILNDLYAKKYHLQPDTTSEPYKAVSNLLFGNDHHQKAGFLNQLYIPTKSGQLVSARWRLDSIVVRSWSEEAQKVEKTRRQLILPGSGGLEMTVKNYEWNADESHWQIAEALSYFFNEQGRLDSMEHRLHVTLNYLFYTKTHYTYENGMLHTEWSEEKFDEYDEWEKTQQMVYEYDHDLQLTRVLTQKIDPFSSMWETFGYISYQYDSLGNLINETGYDYEGYDMTSTKTYELEYTYNSENQLDKIIEYIEGWEQGVFVPERMQRIDYNTEQKIEMETFFNWDYDTDKWLEDSRKLYSHGTVGTQIHEVKTQEWNEKWYDKTKAVYFADGGVLRNETEFQEFLFSFLPVYEFNGKVCDRMENTQYLNGSWQNSGSTYFHFSATWPVDVEPDAEFGVIFYPNPVNDQLFVETPGNDAFDCMLFDVYGRKLLHKKVAGKAQLNVSGLLPGYYIIKLSDNGYSQFKGKLIKR